MNSCTFGTSTLSDGYAVGTHPIDQPVSLQNMSYNVLFLLSKSGARGRI
jgi:hypothetical protein